MKLAADKHRSTPIENNELEFVLSGFIGVHRRQNGFFQRPVRGQAHSLLAQIRNFLPGRDTDFARPHFNQAIVIS